ncbi:MAG: PAS domain-containing sensor histidine kinase, partial [Chitinophagaceae bacterium]|nr:PAS domain-containing sensor histidine kinase [Chitinophagaceae bacterium]
LGKLANAFNGMSKQVQHAEKELRTRVENYKILFESNPMPMWIISKDTLDVLNVNNAAIDHFGYTLNEFLTLNSMDLRPAEDIEKYKEYIKSENFNTTYRGIWRHKKSDGSVVMLEINSANITYSDQPARLILANDITDKLNAEAQLVRHRGMEQELISETTLQVQENEREELGKELHDNINQILFSTKLYLEIARSGNEARIHEAISKSYENVNLAILEIRRLSKKMVAPSLDTSLIEVIKELAEEIQAITPITTSLVSTDFQEHLLHDNMKLMLYRVIQEQVNNILKHAAASDVTITLKTENGQAFMAVSDNGIGFLPHKRSKGIGLRNIDNRVKFYDGEVIITSEPGKGTRLEVSVPLNRKTKLAM